MYGDTSKAPCQTTGLFYFSILPLRTSFSKHRFVLNTFIWQTRRFLACKGGNHVSGGEYSDIIVNHMIREDLISVFLITAADPSHLFRMTFYRLIQESWSRPPEGAR